MEQKKVLQNLQSELLNRPFSSLLFSFDDGKIRAIWTKTDSFDGFIYGGDVTISQDIFLEYPNIMYDYHSMEIVFQNGYQARKIYFQREGGYKEPLFKKIYASGSGNTLLEALTLLEQDLERKKEYDFFQKNLENKILEVSFSGELLKGFWMSFSQGELFWNGNYQSSAAFFSEYQHFMASKEEGFTFQFSKFQGVYKVSIIYQTTIISTCSGVDFDEVMKQVDAQLEKSQSLLLQRTCKENNHVI